MTKFLITYLIFLTNVIDTFEKINSFKNIYLILQRKQLHIYVYIICWMSHSLLDAFTDIKHSTVAVLVLLIFLYLSFISPFLQGTRNYQDKSHFLFSIFSSLGSSLPLLSTLIPFHQSDVALINSATTYVNLSPWGKGELLHG